MAESATEHKDLLVLQSLVALAGNAGSLPESVLLLQQFLAIRPTQLRARHLLRSIEIILYEQSSRLSRSVVHLKVQALLTRALGAKFPTDKILLVEEALALEPFSVKANLMLAQVARELHLSPVAAFAYELVCQEAPDERAHRHELGRIYETTKDWVEAHSVYHEVLQMDPDDLVAQEGIQRVLVELRQLQENPAAPAAAPAEEAAAPELDDVQMAEMNGRLQQLQTQLARYQQKPTGQPTISPEPTKQQTKEQIFEREKTVRKLVSEMRSLTLSLTAEKARRAPQDMEIQFQLAQAFEDSELFGNAMAIHENLREIENFRERVLVRMAACYIKEAYRQIVRRRQEAIDDPTLQAAPEAFPGEYSRPEEANWF